jgi:hypothetical protein
MLSKRVPRFDDELGILVKQASTEQDFLEFLAANSGDYRIVGENIIFTTPGNRVRYNGLVKACSDAAEAAKSQRNAEFAGLEANKEAIKKIGH